MTTNKHICILFFLFITYLGYANVTPRIVIDSLNHELSICHSDTLKIKLYNELAHYYAKVDLDSAFDAAQSGLEIAQKLNMSFEIMKMENGIAIFHYQKGDYNNALQHFLNSVREAEKTKDTIAIAKQLGNVGIIYRRMENYDKALEYYNKAVRLVEIAGGDPVTTGKNHNNIGEIYREKNMLDSALYHYNKSLAIKEEMGDSAGISISLNNIGVAYSKLGRYDEALSCFIKTLNHERKTSEPMGLCESLNNIGNIYILKDDPKKSFAYLEEALKIGLSQTLKGPITSSYLYLSSAYEATSNFSAALNNYKLYTAYKDSMYNEEKSKDIGKLEAKYEMEKQQEEQARSEEEKRLISEKEKTRRDNLQYSIILVAILFVFGGVLTLGKINVSPKFVEGLIFFAFLILFEFCLVLLDPYVEQYSSGEPAYKLLFNALLAGGIFPLHSLFENQLKKRLLKTE